MDRGQEAGPWGRRQDWGQEAGPAGGRAGRGLCPRCLSLRTAARPSGPLPDARPLARLEGEASPQLSCAPCPAASRTAPSSAQVGPLGVSFPLRACSPTSAGEARPEVASAVGSHPCYQRPVSTEGPPSLGPRTRVHLSWAQALSFPAWGRRVEISRIAVSCSFPRGQALGHPEPILLGTVRVLRASGLSLGQEGAPRLISPRTTLSRVAPGPACSTGLQLLLSRSWTLQPQPPGSPGPSSWNVPGGLAPPGTTGDRSFPSRPAPARPGTRANQARGRPCAEVTRSGLDARDGRVGGTGSDGGQCLEPQSQTPELPHRQRFTANPKHPSGPGLAPPPGGTALPPGCCAWAHPWTRGRRGRAGLSPGHGQRG